MISEENKLKLIKRLHALKWHALTMFAPVVIDFIGTNIELFNFPTWLVIGVGLILAQCTKWINSSKKELPQVETD